MKILAIGAHLDDIEIACGGTLYKAINEGHTVKAVIMSKSGYLMFDGRVGRTDEDAVMEGTAALNSLGITDITILDFPNKNIQFNAETVEALDRIISEYHPDLIYTHHPFDTHQDHLNVSKATIAAARRMNNILFYEPVYPSGRSYVAYKPQAFIRLTEEELSAKLNALRKHKTEYIKFGSEDWIDSVRSRVIFRGSEIGTKYAESFEILRLELFREDI